MAPLLPGPFSSPGTRETSVVSAKPPASTLPGPAFRPPPPWLRSPQLGCVPAKHTCSLLGLGPGAKRPHSPFTVRPRDYHTCCVRVMVRVLGNNPLFLVSRMRFTIN